MLKKLSAVALAAALLLPGAAFASRNSKISDNGYYLPKGIKLQGKVKIVTSNPDIKVKVDNTWPDLKVKAVSNFPDQIGKWQFVDNWQDFTIQYVTSGEDIKIKFDDTWPGVVK